MLGVRSSKLLKGRCGRQWSRKLVIRKHEELKACQLTSRKMNDSKTGRVTENTPPLRAVLHHDGDEEGDDGDEEEQEAEEL